MLEHERDEKVKELEAELGILGEINCDDPAADSLIDLWTLAEDHMFVRKHRVWGVSQLVFTNKPLSDEDMIRWQALLNEVVDQS